MKTPLTLGIETTNPTANAPPGVTARPGVALLEGRAVLGVEATAPPGAAMPQDDLIPATDRLFRRVGRVPSQLTRVCVSAGPGGFTAVRLAVTTAKMIAEATGAACVSVPTANVVAHGMTGQTRPFGVALASKGDSTYLTVFDPGDTGAVPRSAALVTAETLPRGLGLLVADQFLPAAIRARCAEVGVPIILPTFDPVACALAGEGIKPIDPVALLPIYPREPEAVTKWRALHPPPIPPVP